jgi:hypothetical protein
MACYGAPCTNDLPCMEPETPDGAVMDDAGIDAGADAPDGA